MKKGFTLIEILVVTTIIGMLATVGMVTYSGFVKQSRDAKRKADMEQVRAALEMYRSSVGVYPVSLVFGTGSLVDSDGNIYMTKLPQDPQPAKYGYFYESSAPYSDYVLGTHIEIESVDSTCSSTSYSCVGTGGMALRDDLHIIKSVYASPDGPGSGSGVPCNYCLGPLGPK